VFRRIWSLTWPVLVSNALDLAVGLIDLRLVRPFGEAATAALGVSRSVTILVEALALAVTSGVITLISQGVGARGRRRVPSEVVSRFPPDAVVRQSTALVLLLSLPTALAGFWVSGPLLALLPTNEDTRAFGASYLSTWFLGVVFWWGYQLGAALFRGAGNVLTPLKLAVGVSLLQVGLNYLLIYGAGPLPGLEVRGAALGAILARAAGMIAFLLLLLRGEEPLRLRWNARTRWFDRELVESILRIGTPTALANVLRFGSRLVFLGVIGLSSLKQSLQAATAVGFQVRQIGIIVALAFQTATAALVGQALGRGDEAEAEDVGRRSVHLLALLMGAITALLILLAEPLAGLFIINPEVAELGTSVIRWFAVAQFFSALSIGLQGALMGGGDTLPALRYTLLGEWGLMLPLSYLLVVTDHVPGGLLAAWALSPVLTLVLMQRRFRGGQWKKMR
jgi:putative MATE family efflux protein